MPSRPRRTGEDALLKAADHDFGLVILDLLLPGIDGQEVLRGAAHAGTAGRGSSSCPPWATSSRACSACARVPSTTWPSPSPWPSCWPGSTPGSPRRQHRRRPAWLQVGAVRLDLQRRVLHDGNRRTTLSQREFMLLGHLMRRAGEVCTRDELLSDVWGFCFDPGSNVLEVYVGRLRSKIDRWHIETVRNVGYCFSA